MPEELVRYSNDLYKCTKKDFKGTLPDFVRAQISQIDGKTKRSHSRSRNFEEKIDNIQFCGLGKDARSGKGMNTFKNDQTEKLVKSIQDTPFKYLPNLCIIVTRLIPDIIQCIAEHLGTLFSLDKIS